MIILDTHVWVWHVQGDLKLPKAYQEIIAESESGVIGISSISLWEIARAVEHRRLDFPRSVEAWFVEAISYPGIRIIDLTPKIVVESTRLPGKFHQDPADQIIVATARVLDSPLLTFYSRILKYQYVSLLPKK
jgi:PIN domain nuclease of toxin-antitoxin system